MAVAAHERSPQAGHAGAMKDPVCGMSVDPHDREAPARARRTHLLFLLGALRGEVRGGAGDVPRAASAPQAEAGAEGRHLHLPDASRDRAGRARATARSAAWRSSRRRSALEEEGPSAEYLDMRRRFWVSAALSLPLLIWVMGEHLLGLGLPRHPAAAGALAPARARDAGRALGRLADLQALLGIVPEAQPEHVDADRDRRRRRLSVQRRRDARARDLPGRLPRARGPGRRLLRGRGGDRGARPARPGARAPGARAHQRRDQGPARPRARRPRGACATTAPTRRCRSRRSRSATACGCARATRSRSTAWCSKGAARSTSRC